jgi:hypothetical protein
VKGSNLFLSDGMGVTMEVKSILSHETSLNMNFKGKEHVLDTIIDG